MQSGLLFPIPLSSYKTDKMKRGIKITLITIAVLFALIIGSAFAIPYFFKDQIQASVIKAANESLNAKFNFSDVSLSLFRDFPYVIVRLQNVSIRNQITVSQNGNGLSNFNFNTSTGELSGEVRVGGGNNRLRVRGGTKEGWDEKRGKVK